MNQSELLVTETQHDEPLILGPEVLRKSASPESQEERARSSAPAAPRDVPFDPKVVTVGRMNDNECILFDEPHRLSWIFYPPRSRYAFVHRPTADSIIVVFHPWEPMLEAVKHAIRPSEGCAEHGITCIANRALAETVNRGWNPFS